MYVRLVRLERRNTDDSSFIQMGAFHIKMAGVIVLPLSGQNL